MIIYYIGVRFIEFSLYFLEVRLTGRYFKVFLYLRFCRMRVNISVSFFRVFFVFDGYVVRF